MRDHRTVFIVGAGASVPYGLPTGVELTSAASKFLENQSMVLQPTRHKGPRSKYDDVAVRLRRSRTPTIDHYIGQSNQYAKELKVAIAGVLWEREDQALDPKELPQDDWISWIYHSYLQFKSPNDFAENNCYFVSFNYDRLIRGIMATMMANTFDVRAVDALNIVNQPSASSAISIRFHHLHGQLGKNLISRYSGSIVDNLSLTNRDEGGHHGAEHFRSLAASIKTISEFSGDSIYNVQQLFNMATHIVFLGFGYHDELLRRLGMYGTRLESLYGTATFIGGTGFGIRGEQRDRLHRTLGEKFVLGESEEKCTEFLSRTIAA